MKSDVVISRGMMNRTKAARFLGIHRVTLYRLEKLGAAPPSLLVGKRRYYTKEMINQWIRARSLV